MLGLLQSSLINIVLWLWVIIATVIWMATSKNTWGRRAGIVIALFLWLFATRPFVEAVLSPLENCFNPPDVAGLKAKGVNQVVVLTAGGLVARGENLSSAFPQPSMYRFIGGIELCAKLGPDCKLIFSGSAGPNTRIDTALTMRELAVTLDPQRKVMAEASSDRTSEHPDNVRPLVGDRSFILVTSAMHMRRSMNAFVNAGLHPIAYPVDFLSQGGRYGAVDFVPSADNLWKMQMATREYLALMYYSIF